MNAFLTVVPIMLIRYGLLSLIDKEAPKRAAFFAPPVGAEKIAYVIYQTATLAIFIYLVLLKIEIGSVWFYVGLVVYILGLSLFAISTVNYAKPKTNGINLNGLYRVSRNPMYIAYFICFLGCVFLTRSYVLLALVIVFQMSSHWIIVSEERWCISKFGEEYIKYMDKVRRYL